MLTASIGEPPKPKSTFSTPPPSVTRKSSLWRSFRMIQARCPCFFYMAGPGPSLSSIPASRSTSQTPLRVFTSSLPAYQGMFSSPPPLKHDYRQIDAADSLDAFLRGLGLGPYVVMGGNMGAQVDDGLTSRVSCRGCHRKAFLVPSCRSINYTSERDSNNVPPACNPTCRHL
jgi:hypothetical protein